MTSRTDAKQKAEGMGGRLASIRSAQDEKVIGNLSCVSASSETFWVGGYRKTPTSFAWLPNGNGMETVIWGDGKSANVYTNWEPLEPNNHGGENCLELYDNLRWNDGSCNWVLSFLVEYEVELGESQTGEFDGVSWKSSKFEGAPTDVLVAYGGMLFAKNWNSSTVEYFDGSSWRATESMKASRSGFTAVVYNK